MILIPCTAACRYQEDGCCRLERASTGEAVGSADCINFVALSAENSDKGLSDITGGD